MNQDTSRRAVLGVALGLGGAAAPGLAAQAGGETAGAAIAVPAGWRGTRRSKEDIVAISDEQMVRTFETNIFAYFRIARLVARDMAPGSVVLNVGSVDSYDPGEELLDYAATKGAILIFTKGLAKQLAKRGIRVNMIAPGPIWTPLQVAGGQLPDQMSEFGQDTPLGRAGQPAELAPLFVTLASGEASFSTGTAVGAHGGKGRP